LFESSVIHVDKIPAQMLIPGSGKPITPRFFLLSPGQQMQCSQQNYCANQRVHNGRVKAIADVDTGSGQQSQGQYRAQDADDHVAENSLTASFDHQLG
jgi:hypothetical protein